MPWSQKDLIDNAVGFFLLVFFCISPFYSDRTTTRDDTSPGAVSIFSTAVAEGIQTRRITHHMGNTPPGAEVWLLALMDFAGLLAQIYVW